MKKFLSFFGLLTTLSSTAQDKIYFHLDDGYSVEYDLSKIDSISYERRLFNVVAEKTNGVLPGKFSVSDTSEVNFSRGNLQYQASTDTWRFAPNQYDLIGDDNVKISSTNTEWQDLFGWGTSGYDGKFPYIYSANTSYYAKVQDLQGTEYDWGAHNAIVNGGNQSGLWRTLSNSEWTYLFTKRENANNLYFNAKIEGITGKVILPDGFQMPSYFNIGNKKLVEFTVDLWNLLESQGAVFLPYAGYRAERSIKNPDELGVYWSSTKSSSMVSYSIYMNDGVSTSYSYSSLYFGCSVRLVKDANK